MASLGGIFAPKKIKNKKKAKASADGDESADAERSPLASEGNASDGRRDDGDEDEGDGDATRTSAPSPALGRMPSIVEEAPGDEQWPEEASGNDYGDGEEDVGDVEEEAVEFCRSIKSLDVPLDFVLATKEAVEIHSFKYESALNGDKLTSADTFQKSFPAVQGADGINWSPDGRWLGVLDYDTGALQVLAAGEDYEHMYELSSAETSPARSFHFSPLGTYAVCFEPQGGEEDVPIVRVWLLADMAEIVGTFAQERNDWPVLKWTADEEFCCRLTKDEIQVFLLRDFDHDAMQGAISCDGVSTFEVSQRENTDEGPSYVALFVPSRGKDKASCKVYSLDDLSTPTATQTFPQAERAQLKWNPAGTALLVLTSTEVDTTGKSYYGNTKLHLLHADGSYVNAICAKEGTIHDVAWSPTDNEFLLLQGELPNDLKISLLDGQRGKLLLDFGKNPRNRISWSPLGRFFAVGGFGQLPGDIDFWHRPAGDIRPDRTGQTRYGCCVDCQWSADGRYVMGWTTTPRLRVENRIELFDYAGDQLLKLEVEELYAASWRPMPLEDFPDLPPTPGRIGRTGVEAAAGGSQKKEAYRAPGSSGNLAAQLRAATKDGDRTTARTGAESAAEAAEEQREAKAKKKAQEEALRRPEKKYREVPIPAEMLGAFIGMKGATIKALQLEAKIAMEVKQKSSVAKQSGESSVTAYVQIGPLGAWDDVERAEELVKQKVEQIIEERQRKIDKKNQEETRTVPIEDELVPRFIGANGAAIQELKNEGGVKLRVRDADDGKGRIVLIGPAPADALASAAELVEARIESLRNEPLRKEDRKTSWNKEIPSRWDKLDGDKDGKKARDGDKQTQKGWDGEKNWWEDGRWRNAKSWGNGGWNWDSNRGDNDEDTKDDKGWRAQGWWEWEDDGGKAEDSARRPWPSSASNAKPSRDVNDTADQERRQERGQSKEKDEVAENSATKSADAKAAEASAFIEETRAKADEAFAKNNLEEAIALYTKCVRKTTPQDSLSLAGRSAAYLKMGEAHSAYRDAGVLVRLQPDLAIGHLCKGLAQFALGQEQNGEVSLKECLRLDPDNAEAKEALLSTPPASREPPAQARASESASSPKVERAHKCNECGDAAAFGAVDESDGMWYCKACWEKFMDPNSAAEAEAPAEKAAAAAAADEAPTEEAAPAEKPPPERRRWADEPIEPDRPAESTPKAERSMDRDRWAELGTRDRDLDSGSRFGRDRRRGFDRSDKDGGKGTSRKGGRDRERWDDDRWPDGKGGKDRDRASDRWADSDRPSGKGGKDKDRQDDDRWQDSERSSKKGGGRGRGKDRRDDDRWRDSEKSSGKGGRDRDRDDDWRDEDRRRDRFPEERSGGKGGKDRDRDRDGDRDKRGDDRWADVDRPSKKGGGRDRERRDDDSWPELGRSGGKAGKDGDRDRDRGKDRRDDERWRDEREPEKSGAKGSRGRDRGHDEDNWRDRDGRDEERWPASERSGGKSGKGSRSHWDKRR